MSAGCVGIVDFGIMGFLDDDMMRHVAHLLLGFAEHDYDMVMEALEDAGILRPNMENLQEFRTDLKDVAEPFYGRSLRTVSVRDIYDQVMQLVLKYHIKLPRNLLLLFKTLIQTEALGKILESHASLLEVSRPYAKKFLEKSYDPQNLFTGMAKDAREFGSYLKSAPRWIHDILKQTAAGKQRIELHHTGFSEMDTRLEKGINRLTIGIVIAASTIAASLILNSSQKVIEFSVDFLGRQTLSITGILGLAGYTIATFLGIWLIVSIFRSGKM
jgi:ubiquinone biosynthesis protein